MDARAGQRRSVTVIATVLNEGETIRDLLDSLEGQTRRPDEIVVVDGGSSDQTVEILRSYQGRLPLRILISPGANISKGRNAAITAAYGEVIASTDAGVRLDPRWLEELLIPFERENGSRPDVVSGFFLPDPRSVFELAMGATVLPRSFEIAPERFLPSSRSVAFLRRAWEQWSYPEWLDYCEDLIFDLGLKALGYQFEFRSQAIVYFRPRSSLRAFFRQYFRYARGDGKADLWRKRHLVRYGTYVIVTPALLALMIMHSPWWVVAFGLGSAIYLWPAYRRLWHELRGLSAVGRLQVLAWVPIIRVVGDFAKMIGYPVGLWWRWRQRKNPEIYWRRRVEEARLESRPFS